MIIATTRIRGLTCHLGYVLLALQLCSYACAGDVTSIERIWLERFGRIQELHLSWTEETTHYTLPGEVSHGTGEFALSARGIRMLCDSYVQPDDGGPEGVVRSSGASKTRKERNWFVYDNAECVTMFEPSEERPYHKVFVSTNAPQLTLDFRFAAIQQFCRAFDKRIGVFPSGLSRLSSRPGKAEGLKCVIIQDGDVSHWVTDDERALLVRSVWNQPKTTMPSIDIRSRYKEDADTQEWLPSGWDYTRYGTDGASVIESRKATVTDASVHRTLPAQLFSLEIPKGSWVTQVRGGRESVYIERGEGDKRPILPGEFNGANYDALLNSEPPVLAAPKTSRSGLWIANGVLMMLALSAFALMRRNRSTAASRSQRDRVS